ncbi:MAG: metal ABC transporter ATP-binding protein [Candidatus Cloacimonetes bacterium]|nr:metal ABC transporter ATP-binding protein [Candidatus Cloacimonadota bacterium]MDD3142904.1 metal ABC transporter ATP-binding protein [Candidatus Cloacimonadota bacterium]MDY0367845.1 metal ABC transporter ATP-binding protein [Candidatus Syntrophosphaera sp.]HOY84549.1 metal ABC transporter ATP-binding protein [Candidatus Syntrophosphaera sp.]HPH60159.1 metal ABC transporter ATP-binding protein [Candidatus Syntrophosphaera sp.]
MIKISGLSHHYGGNPVLEDIDLELADGEFVAIIGPNGAGKSTLIKLILGLLPLQSGSIEIDGLPHLQWLRSHPLGYLPQHEEFDRKFPATALDLVLLGLAGELGLGRRFSAVHKDRARQALAKTRIADLAKKPLGSLSGGELQRVYLARALVSESDYLILDEPEASVDLPGVQSFFSLLKDLNEAGKTVITISHDLNTLTQYCSFLVCLNRRLHCHTQTDLVNAELIHKTFGETVRIIEKDY